MGAGAENAEPIGMAASGLPWTARPISGVAFSVRRMREHSKLPVVAPASGGTRAPRVRRHEGGGYADMPVGPPWSAGIPLNWHVSRRPCAGPKR